MRCHARAVRAVLSSSCFTDCDLRGKSERKRGKMREVRLFFPYQMLDCWNAPLESIVGHGASAAAANNNNARCLRVSTRSWKWNGLSSMHIASAHEESATPTYH